MTGAADIKERNQFLNQIEQEDLNFRTIINSIADEIWICNAEGRLSIANEAALRGLGIQREKDIFQMLLEWLEHLEIYDISGTPRAKEDAPLLRSLYGEKVVDEEEIVIHPKTGKRLYRHVNSSPLRSDEGDILGAIAVVRDITEKKLMEQELKDSRQLLEFVYSSLDEAVFVIDTGSRHIISCNRAAEEMFGYSASEMIGQNTEFIHENREKYLEFGTMLFPLLDQKQTFKVEYKMRKKDGTVFPTDHTVKEIRDYSGERMMVVSVVRDISHEKAMFRELKQKEMDLKENSRGLEEMNIALKVLLENRDRERADFEKGLSEKVNALIIPYVNRIKKSGLNDLQTQYLNILESNLNELLKPLSQQNREKLMLLSPSETRVANLVRDGYRIKEIARELNISPRTVEFHRDNIRKKFGIKERSVNLKIYLSSLF